MKNQYFGDINDYRKYGLLRCLSGQGVLRTAICWMLTPDDDRGDGGRTGYLHEPGKWRAYDPPLFDSLAGCLAQRGSRNIVWAESSGILPGATFYTNLLTDNAAERRQYLREFLVAARDCELVFFDPDNGLEVGSVPYGRSGSRKYLYWHELRDAFQATHSILVYQHFPRVRREPFIEAQSQRVLSETGASEVLSFRTAHVLFLLAPQPVHLDHLRHRSQEVARRWRSEIQVANHRPDEQASRLHVPETADPLPPESSLRVLDLSALLPGPYCSRILADLGAEVIKVERPGGSDWMRHAPPLDPDTGTSLHYQALNRGKLSLTLNLKSDEGRAIFLHLVRTADVLLETFRPGVMERLELAHHTLADANPRLVYASLNGYGSHGPYRERAGHDLNYVGLSGLLHATGPQGRPPPVLGAPVSDVVGALWASVGIVHALLERTRTGRGQRVDASLLGAALSCLPLAVAHAQAGKPLARGTGVVTGGQVCYQVYQTLDGEYVTLAALEPRFWDAFCQAVGRQDLTAEQAAPALPGETAFDELCALFRTRTRQEWVDALAGLDVCCEPVYAVDEALASAPVEALGMLTAAGLRAPLALSGLTQVPPGPAPALGQHTASLLADFGYSAADVEGLRQEGIV
jgi:crotonobetainyl-CoA:carnitine CoA-transferase CaiB-like acyl-CoA transferase